MASSRPIGLRSRIERVARLADAIARDCRTGAGAVAPDDDLRRCRIVVDHWGDAAASIKTSLANVLDSRKSRP